MPRLSFAAVLILLLGLSICFWTFAVNGADKKTDEKSTLDDKAILAIIQKRTNDFVRVTEKAVPMRPDVKTLCVSPQVGRTAMKNPHWNYDLHVYVPKDSERIIRSGKGSYPVGAFILKEKLSARNNKSLSKTNDNSGNKARTSSVKELAEPALFTAMLKREKGYNPTCGDWEFITISGDAKEITSRGKTESCMNCHRGHKETDFVTRTYMNDEPAAKNKLPIEKKTSNKK
jgi:hypothetical protein